MSRNDQRQVPRLWGWAKISYTVLYTDTASFISDCAASFLYVICGKTLDYASTRMNCIIVATSSVVVGAYEWVCSGEGRDRKPDRRLYVQIMSAITCICMSHPAAVIHTQRNSSGRFGKGFVGGFITLPDCGIIGSSDYRINDSRCSGSSMID